MNATATTKVKKETTPKKPAKKAAMPVFPVKKFDAKTFSGLVAVSRFGQTIISIPKEQEKRSKIPSSAVYATGKRKTSVARVWMWEAMPECPAFAMVGAKNCSVYFNNTLSYLAKIQKPFDVTGLNISSFCIYSSLIGGGISMKSEALALGLSKIIATKFPDLKPILKKAKLLTRDSRIVEPKKTGLRGARKKEQYSKR